MDGRIFFAGTRQLSAQRTQDLPVLAKAICGFERGLVAVERVHKRNVNYVRFFANNFELYVLESDWLKVVPHLKTGQFNPQIGPPPIPTLRVQAFCGTLELADLEVWDAVFYQKVYQALQLVFTQSYPTSHL